MFILYFSLLFNLSWAENTPTKPKAAKKAKMMSWVAHVMRQKGEKKITGLKVLNNQLPVYLVPSKGDLRPLVELQMTYIKPGWGLFTSNGKPIGQTKVHKNYKLYAFLNSQVSELAITAKNEAGDKQKETLYIFAPEAQEFNIVSPWSAISAWVGIHQLTYEQTRFGTLSVQGSSIGVSYFSSDKSNPWGFHTDGSMTVYTLHSEPLASNPQYITARVDVKYRLPFLNKSRWRLYGYLGIAYFNLTSNGSPFGFSSLFTPDLSILAKNFLTTKSSFNYELRLTPFENFNFSQQRGFHFSWHWSKILKSSRRQDLGFKFSDTRFLTSKQNIGVQTLTVFLGYSL